MLCTPAKATVGTPGSFDKKGVKLLKAREHSFGKKLLKAREHSLVTINVSVSLTRQVRSQVSRPRLAILV